MSISIDHGRKLACIDGRPHIVEEVSTRDGDQRPARAGFRPVRTYTSRALGQMTLWARSFPIYPTGEHHR